jgi:hypothetical protein
MSDNNSDIESILSASTNDDAVDLSNEYESSVQSWSTTASQDDLRFKFARVVNRFLGFNEKYTIFLTGHQCLQMFDEKMKPFLQQRSWSYPHYLEYKRAEIFYLEAVMLSIRVYSQYKLKRIDMEVYMALFPKVWHRPMPTRDYSRFPHTRWDMIDKLPRWRNYTEELFIEDSRNEWYMSYRDGPNRFVPQPEIVEEVCFSDDDDWQADQMILPDPIDPKIEVPLGVDIINDRCADGLSVDGDSDGEESDNCRFDYDQDDASVDQNNDWYTEDW